jgi:DNA-binding MarR family transcriptional regulator
MNASTKNQDVIRRFGWAIISIGAHFEELRHFWAKVLGISGPQWMIITALADLDSDEGAPVYAVSRMLQVDSSFVATQSKLLEKKGFVRRRTSREDAGLVNLYLTDKTRKHLADLALRQDSLNEFILAELPARELEELTAKLAAIEKRLEEACLKAAAHRPEATD